MEGRRYWWVPWNHWMCVLEGGDEMKWWHNSPNGWQTEEEYHSQWSGEDYYGHHSWSEERYSQQKWSDEEYSHKSHPWSKPVVMAPPAQKPKGNAKGSRNNKGKGKKGKAAEQFEYVKEELDDVSGEELSPWKVHGIVKPPPAPIKPKQMPSEPRMVPPEPRMSAPAAVPKVVKARFPAEPKNPPSRRMDDVATSPGYASSEHSEEPEEENQAHGVGSSNDKGGSPSRAEEKCIEDKKKKTDTVKASMPVAACAKSKPEDKLPRATEKVPKPKKKRTRSPRSPRSMRSPRSPRSPRPLATTLQLLLIARDLAKIPETTEEPGQKPRFRWLRLSRCSCPHQRRNEKGK
jgi:hypothetical protein